MHLVTGDAVAPLALWITMSAVLPGTVQLYAGKRRRGWILLAITFVVLGIAAYFVGRGRLYLLKLSVQPDWLLALLWAALVLAVAVLGWLAFRSLR